MKLMFIPAKYKKSILPAIKKNLTVLKKYKSIGLLATVQFVSQLDSVKKLLGENKIKAFIGQPSNHAVQAGQILGCDATAGLNMSEKADCLLYIGTGEFHPLAAELNTELPVLKLNPFTNSLTQITLAEKTRWFNKHAARVYKANQAKTYGIFVTTKPGQYQLGGHIKHIKDKLVKKNKKAYIFVADLINPQELLNFPQIQAWINTACPRIVDDQSSYNKPLVNPDEIK